MKLMPSRVYHVAVPYVFANGKMGVEWFSPEAKNAVDARMEIERGLADGSIGKITGATYGDPSVLEVTHRMESCVKA